ncbi:MAG: DUF2202 domain-containing protein [Anaerolineales bacterium]
MSKKIIVIVLLVGLVGILMIGAANRTLARTGSDGNGQGRGRQAETGVSNEIMLGSNENNQDYSRNGYGRNRGSAQEEAGSTIGVDTSAGVSQYGGYGRSNRDETVPRELVLKGDGDLYPSDQEALIFMREEEKLAKDVYLAMYEQWGLPIFLNISSSEQSHTEAIKSLLDGYNMADPASDELGVFTKPDLQVLYNDLVAQGSQSSADALRVGATIEEIDILDLQERLAQTENSDIQRVFNNLLQGSSNHLRAFTSTLSTQTGTTYQPQFMSTDDFQAIIDGANVGNGQGRGASGGRRGRP